MHGLSRESIPDQLEGITISKNPLDSSEENVFQDDTIPKLNKHSKVKKKDEESQNGYVTFDFSQKTFTN